MCSNFATFRALNAYVRHGRVALANTDLLIIFNGLFPAGYASILRNLRQRNVVSWAQEQFPAITRTLD